MKIIAPKRLMVSVFPTVRNGGIFNASSLDLQFARTKTLDPRVTFTRASSGTYVGSDGLIKTATTNLLLRSEEFGATWTLVTASISSDVTIAPNGTNTADKLIVNNGQSAGYAAQTTSFVNGLTYTASCYAKAGEVSDFRFVFESAAFSSNLNAVFNLATGTVSSFTASSASIQPVGNGWYRCIATATATISASAGVQFRSVHAGNGANGIFLWGAQLEQSSTVGEYIPTTSTINSAPRFDHNPTTRESLGLLVEEQRTNLHIRSEEFGDAAWTVTPTESSVTTDATTAPNGASTADLFKCLTTNDIVRRLVTTTAITVANTTAYTASIFLKAENWRYVGLAINSNATNFNLSAGRCTFDLQLGTFSDVLGLTNQQAQQLPNGWWRVSITGTTVTTAATLRISLQDAAEAANLAAVGVVDAGIYLWGAQLEAGAFPTSYIPTTTAAVTRSADVASITGASFSSWYRQDEGSFFCSTTAPKGTIVFGTGDTFDNTQYVTVAASNNVSIRSGGSAQAILTAPVSSSANTNIALSYALNSFAAVSNGGTISTDTSGAVPLAQVRLKLGSSPWISSAGNDINGTIRRLTYWPSRLPNTTLQEITQ
jgi:hypothetical protein